MPLRDHFNPPLDDYTSWDGFHGGWPMVIVQHLKTVLPTGFVSMPIVHPDAEYEVRIYDANRGRRLAAAIEIVSPANKDRPHHRRLFVAKCAALLQQSVSVVIVDLVTTRRANLFTELLAWLDQPDAVQATDAQPLYTVACRWRAEQNTHVLEAWQYPMHLGQALPTVPLWLTAELAVALDLERSYEQTCADLSII